MPLKSRPTIGLFAPSPSFPWAVRQWEGMVQGAQDFDINLVSYIGGVIGSPRYAGQASVLYDLAAAKKLDGLLIWSAAIGWNLSRPELIAFSDRYRSIPRISLEVPLPGIPCVVMDNFQGMREMVTHLIRDHGCRRIAFLGGSIHHEGAQERYRAYQETLAEYGLPFDARLVPTSAAVWDAFAMTRTLVEEQGGQFDALVSASDDMLLEALQVLQSHGIRVPEDVAVTGFDNIPETMSVTPPITTCKPPFYEMGRKAMELLMAQLAGEPVPDRVTMPVRVLIRQSCGCASPVLREASEEVQQLNRLSLSLDSTEIAAEPNPEAIRKALGSALGPDESLPTWFWKDFVDEVSGTTSGNLLARLNHRLNEMAAMNRDIFVWLPALAALQRAVQPWTSQLSQKDRLRADSLWRQAHALVGEVAQRVSARRNLSVSTQQSILKTISETLITTFDREDLLNTVVRELPRLGIASCYLSLYVHPEHPTGDARLILAYDERGRHLLPPGGIEFPSSQLAPPEFWTTQRRFSRLVLALYFQTENIGFAMFDLHRHEDVALCEALRWQLSSALKGASLVQMEREFFHDQKLNSLGILAGGVAHDFNNILSIILTNSELALMKLPQDSPAIPKIQTIRKASVRATDLAKQMLAYSGRGVFHIESLDLNTLLEEMVDLLRVSLSKGSVLEMHLWATLPSVNVDATQIRQVVMNLIINASEAIGDHGVITISTGVWSDDYVFLKIADTGIGMDRDTLNKLFDPFFTTKFEGRGLGLSAVQGIIRAHRGEISVHSEPNRGSTFLVKLPVSAKPLEAPRLGTEEKNWTVAGTVLFVDDEEELRLVGQEILSQLGFAVRLASNCQEAVAIVGSGLKIDLVILDLTMPGTGGEQCFAELRQINPDLRIVLSSGYNAQEATARLLDKGLAGFLPKPYTIDEMKSMIQSLALKDNKGSTT